MQLVTHSCSAALGKEHSVPGQAGVGVGFGVVGVEVLVSMVVVEVVVSKAADEVGSSQGVAG